MHHCIHRYRHLSAHACDLLPKPCKHCPQYKKRPVRFTGRLCVLIHRSCTTAYTVIAICPPMRVTCFLSHVNIALNTNKRPVNAYRPLVCAWALCENTQPHELTLELGKRIRHCIVGRRFFAFALIATTALATLTSACIAVGLASLAACFNVIV